MADLLVIVPSRERVRQARELADAFEATCVADTKLVFAVDEGDPVKEEYRAEASGRYGLSAFRVPVHCEVVLGSKNMGQALHGAALKVATQPVGRVLGEPLPFAIGFMGDDHRPRTVGWDKAYLDALRELGTGIVYGNDLLQGENIPTQVAMTSDIIRALGYMAPPSLVHLYLDNFWKVLGNGADCLRYLPDVIVEHMHPVAGKAKWDEGYKRVNSQAMYAHDKAAFEDWLRTSMLSDVAKVRALR